ncbi:MAG: beta-lactamase family protein [Rhodospirillales bacterium]|nr:beta-lactamase family protein [Rhodospirillales bacterium]
MRWHKAMETAAEIAAGWTADGGPGGAIRLFDDTSIRAEAFGGLANLELMLPFTASTAVRYASISKHFMAATLLRLQEQGVLSLEDELGRHLSGLADLPAAVPIGRALDMTSGLPDAMETLWLLGVPWTADLSRTALRDFVSAIDALNFAPGTEISYSNTGYRLLEAALHHAGRDYGALLAEWFFQPLGLTMMLPEDETVPVPGLAAGYHRTASGWRRGRYGMHVSASGGLTGTAHDLVTWLQALLTDAAPAAGLLPRLGARRHLADGRATEYGLGLARSPVPGQIAVGHGGSLPGYKHHFLLLPAQRAGVVVLTNREDADAHGIALRVIAALTGADLPDPAIGLLPQGRFVTEDGPFWIEQQGGALTFMGATETLYRGEDETAVSRSAHLPVALRYVGDAIEGEIGHVGRRFRPAMPDAVLGPAWSGTWINAQHEARFDIQAGETPTLAIGTGPLRVTLPLDPLDERRALTDRTAGPWRQRACLVLDGDTLRVASNRSRVLVFRRA